MSKLAKIRSSRCQLKIRTGNRFRLNLGPEDPADPLPSTLPLARKSNQQPQLKNQTERQNEIKMFVSLIVLRQITIFTPSPPIASEDRITPLY